MKEGEKLCGIVKEVKMGRCMTAGVHKSLYFSISLATHKTSAHKDLTRCFKLLAKGPAAVFHRETSTELCTFTSSTHHARLCFF